MRRLLYTVVFISACASDPTSSTECAQDVVQMPTTAVCAATTKTCLTGCAETDDTCWDNCFTADPAAESCSECIDDAYTACVNAAGCQADYDAMQCCINGCADPDSDDCYNTTCQQQVTAYDNCSSAKGDACDDAVCFKAM
jgi:hypothetical protein